LVIIETIKLSAQIPARKIYSRAQGSAQLSRKSDPIRINLVGGNFSRVMLLGAQLFSMGYNQQGFGALVKFGVDCEGGNFCLLNGSGEGKVKLSKNGKLKIARI
jgi:hypothetical protein